MPITLKRALEVAGTVIVDGYEVEDTEYSDDRELVPLQLTDGDNTVVRLDVNQTRSLNCGYADFLDADGKTVNIGFFETVPITDESA